MVFPACNEAAKAEGGSLPFAEIDTYANGTSDHSNETTIFAKGDISSGSRNIYLKFGLDTLYSDSTVVDTATLYLTPSHPNGIYRQRYNVNYLNTDNFVSGITGPQSNAILSSLANYATISSNIDNNGVDVPVGTDVTNCVKNAMESKPIGLKKASFWICAASPTSAGIYFYSQEATTDSKGNTISDSYKPRLEITTTNDVNKVAVTKDSIALDLAHINGLPNLNYVTGNLVLPSTGTVKNSSISWASSDQSVIENDGTVHRPADSKKTVTLTATISSNDPSSAPQTTTKSFNVTVAPDFTDEESLAADKMSLDTTMSAYTQVPITSMPANLTIVGAYQTIITWSSSNPDLISVDNATGAVTFRRPGLQDATVTLTAALQHGNASESVQYQITIAHLILMAEKASPDVQAKINEFITSFVPNVVESKTATSTITFTHPGIGITKEMLDNMRDHVRAYDEPWATAFTKYSAVNGSLNPTMRILDPNDTRDYVNIPSGGIYSDAYYQIRNMEQDGWTAYSQTIMWYITGNQIYRQNAMNIIREWCKVQSIGSIYDEQIRVSLAVYGFCMAAEILRSSTGNTAEYNWTSTDTANFVNFLNLMKSKYDRYTHFMNQHGFCVMGYMASAVFRDDDANYAIAVQRATTNPELGSNYDFTSPTCPHNRDGSIISQIRAVTKNVLTGETVSPPNIQVVEMGRDQAHPYADIGALSTAAMITNCQRTKVDPTQGTLSTAANGVEVFHFLNDRILVGANYLCKYNLGNDVTYIPCYTDSNGGMYTTLGATQGTIHGDISTIYGYYAFIEQRSDMDTNENTKYLSQAFAQLYSQGQASDGVLFYANVRSASLSAAQITVKNNLAGIDDTIVVTGLVAGDVIKVYNTGTDDTAIGTAVADGTTATISVPQLGKSAGYVYVTITRSGKTESLRTRVAYLAERRLSFQVAEGKQLNRLTDASPGGTITVNYSAEQDSDATMIVAIYYQDKLLGTHTLQISGKTASVVIALGDYGVTDTNTGAYKVKAFLLYNMATIIPLCESAQLT